jgi:hypothetical protein
MTTNVNYFVDQASKEQFWEENALTELCKNLRNKLAASAEALHQSETAVLAWINIQRAK